jgi:hypothetical protein
VPKKEKNSQVGSNQLFSFKMFDMGVQKPLFYADFKMGQFSNPNSAFFLFFGPKKFISGQEDRIIKKYIFSSLVRILLPKPCKVLHTGIQYSKRFYLFYRFPLILADKSNS